MSVRTILRTALAAGAVAGSLGSIPLRAQTSRAPHPPAPPPALDQIERMETAVRKRRDFYLKPETEAAARASDAKMEEVQKRMDARVRLVTRSICAGCVGGTAPRRPARVSLPDEPKPKDPAQAPLD